jgi:SAM-dependent methyltransferase
MHENSLALMDGLLGRRNHQGSTVLDVGSYDVNGTYREVCKKHGLVYVGFDIAPGPNVMICATSLAGVASESFDIVISGQMLEHDRHPHSSVLHMKRIVKAEGWVILIAPREIPEHKHPIDCWRFLPDGMRVLLEGFEDIDAGVYNGIDTYGVGRKPVGYRERMSIVEE